MNGSVMCPGFIRSFSAVGMGCRGDGNARIVSVESSSTVVVVAHNKTVARFYLRVPWGGTFGKWPRIESMRYTDGQPVKRVVKELCYYGREEPIDTCLRLYVCLSVCLSDCPGASAFLLLCKDFPFITKRGFSK